MCCILPANNIQHIFLYEGVHDEELQETMFTDVGSIQWAIASDAATRPYEC